MPKGKRSKQIGALWKHEAKSGDAGVYLRGNLDLGALGQVPIAVFKNTRKEKENQPDYRIVLSEPIPPEKESPKSDGL